MEKKTVGKFDLDAAFKALDEIEIPRVTPGSRTIANRINLKERLNAKAAHEVLVEDYYDVNDSTDLEAAKTERDAEIAKAKLARIEKIVDLDAKTEEDILPSYIGKYIIQCPQCMTLFYKNEEDIVESEDNPGTVNINEICQHCGNDSGYSLVGKVDGITSDETANFEGEETATEEIPVEEIELDAVEDSEDAAEEGEELDLADLEGLALEDEEETAEEEEETNESLHKSKLLAKIEDQNDLKTDIESDYLTLNEELEGLNKGADIKDPRVRKILARLKKIADVTGTKIGVDNMSSQTELIKKHCSEKECNMLRNVELTDGSVVNMLEEDLADWYRKKFDKPASIDTQQKWEETIFDLEQELAKETDPKKKAKIKQRIKQFQDKFAQQRDWEKNHPDKVNHEPDLKPVTKHEVEEPIPEEVLTEKAKTSAKADKILDNLWNEEQPTEAETRNALKRLVSKTTVENFEDLEDFDEESFDSHITEYLTEVYSNVKVFETTSCSTDKGRLTVEGLLTFNSGKAKKTKFIFEGSKKGIYGYNSDISDSKAFNLKTSVVDNRLLTEGLKYKYSIGETLVKGNTAK